MLGQLAHPAKRATARRNWRLALDDEAEDSGNEGLKALKPQASTAAASAPSKPAKRTLAEVPAPALAPAKRKREYAWMDSGDEASSAGEDDPPSGPAVVTGDGESSLTGANDPAERGHDPEAGLAQISISEVGTLPEMMRVLPQLRKRIGTMRPVELVEVVLAAARVRFYDGEFFGDFLPELRSRLRTRASTFTANEMVDCVAALMELNAYDKVVFSAIAQTFLKGRVGELDTGQRRRILAVYKASGHVEDADFVSLLVQREKQEALAKEGQRQSGDYLVTRSPGQLRPGRF